VATVLVAVAAWLAFGQAALAAPGDLDSSFDRDGRLTFNPGGHPGAFEGVAVQPDGKIVLVGYAFVTPSETDMAVSRVNPDGSLDQGFGAGGTALLNVGIPPNPRSQDVGEAVALQPDGKILVAGKTSDGDLTVVAVARLDSNGNLDTSFKSPGMSVPPGFASGRVGTALAVAVDPAGKIVLAGPWKRLGTSNVDDFVERLNGDGSRDNTFSGDGSSDLVFGSSGADAIFGMALQPDGRIVVAGDTQPGTDSDAQLARVAPGSGLDASFGVGGFRTYGFGTGAFDAAKDVVVQPDGKLDVAGFGSTAENFTLTRLTSDGAFDPSLNGQSTVDADFGGEDAANAIVLLANGKLVLAGGGPRDFALARFQPGGLADETFGTGGKRTVAFPGSSSVADAMALQPDGKIVVAGGAGNTGAVARLLGDPANSGGGPGGSSAPGGGGRRASSRVPRCLGRRATIVGTSKKDRLRGTRRADVIVGLGGNDSITGLGGNDVICGGSGKDKVSGGSGKDKLSGGSGNDKLSGGSGNDRVHGDAGNDRVSGDSGKDLLFGDSGNDRLSGGSGADRLSGGSGKDRLNGGSGKDKLNGGSGRDRCAGRDEKKSC
jgi:uncharacterized delta-60 repeat protein